MRSPDERTAPATPGDADGGLPHLPPAARAILQTAPDALVVSDRHGRIIFLNPLAEDLFGHRGEDVRGQPFERLVPRLVARRKDGGEFPAELSLTSLETEDGPLLVAALRGCEPGEHHMAEERARLAQAQEAVRLRDEFLSVTAHELRTPLAALQLQLDGLDQSLRAIDPAVRERYGRVQAKVDKAVRTVTRLTDLVNTILDLSRIMGGRLRLQLEAADLAVLVREVAAEFSEPERTGTAIVVDAPEALEAVCDRFRFEQILVNLLSNAIKYGQGHPVELKLRADAQAVELSVRDHGIGIAAEDHERIFDKFERASPAHHYGGMGLGLYISRYLAEAHGGVLTVRATVGEGSTFLLRMPRLGVTV